MFDRGNHIAKKAQVSPMKAKEVNLSSVHEPIRAESPDISQKFSLKSNNYQQISSSEFVNKRASRIHRVSNDFINLKNLVERKFPQDESPNSFFQPNCGPTPVFACAPQNSTNNDSVEYQQEFASSKEMHKMLRPAASQNFKKTNNSIMLNSSQVEETKDGNNLPAPTNFRKQIG